MNMHAPEKWGMLQFTTSPPGSDDPVIWNEEWPIRSVAMIIYYAEHAYRDENNFYTDDLAELNRYASPPILHANICSELPRRQYRMIGCYKFEKVT